MTNEDAVKIMLETCNIWECEHQLDARKCEASEDMNSCRVWDRCVDVARLNVEIARLKKIEERVGADIGLCEQIDELETELDLSKHEIARLDLERKKWEADAVRLGKENIEQDEEIARLKDENAKLTKALARQVELKIDDSLKDGAYYNENQELNKKLDKVREFIKLECMCPRKPSILKLLGGDDDNG